METDAHELSDGKQAIRGPIVVNHGSGFSRSIGTLGSAMIQA